jgi:hypothetical protein
MMKTSDKISHTGMLIGVGGLFSFLLGLVPFAIGIWVEVLGCAIVWGALIYSVKYEWFKDPDND